MFEDPSGGGGIKGRVVGATLGHTTTL